MRVMVLLQATRESEAGAMPSEELLTAMGAYNEQLVKAGLMLGGDGLRPTSYGARVNFSGADRSVARGPFSLDENLLAGFWIWKVDSLEEAIEWVKRCPNPMPGGEARIEIRPFVEMEDFGEALTPELKAQEERLREETARNASA